MILPFKISGSHVVDLKENTTQCFKVNPIDNSIYSLEKLQSIYEQYESDLRENQEVLKFFYFNRSAYLNSVENISFNSISVKEVNADEVLKSYLGDYKKNIEFKEHFYRIDNQYTSIIHLKSFEEVEICTLEDFDFVLNLKPVDKQKTISKLDLRRRLHFSNLFKDLKDIDSESSFSESEEYLEKVKKDQDRFYQFESFVYVRAFDVKTLNEKIKEASIALKSKQIEFKVLGKDLSYHFYFNLPGVIPSFKYSKIAPVSFLSSLLPLNQPKVHDFGFELRTNKEGEINFNLFDKGSTNFNALITGSSGEGKSMLANKILLEEIKKDTSIIILDLGNSFKRLVDYHGGVTLDESFNPFQFKDHKYLLEFVKSIIPNLSKFDCGKILSILKESNSINSLENLKDILRDVIEDIGFHFEEYVEHFNEEILENKKLMYVELSKYPDNIKGPLIIYIIEYFKNIQGKKILLMDESWQFLKNNGEFIAETFRTLRKLEGSAIAISQSLDDFTHHDLGKVVFQNCFYRFSFRQKVTNPPIDEHERDYLKSIASIKDKYSEFVLSVGDEPRILRYYPKDLEFILFNSSRNFTRRIESFIEGKKNFFSYKNIINQYKHEYFKGVNINEVSSN